MSCSPNFPSDAYKYAVLYVPTGCTSKYESVTPWSKFLNIEEMAYSGIDNIEDESSEPTVEINNGIITINGNGSVRIYSASGQCVPLNLDQTPRG